MTSPTGRSSYVPILGLDHKREALGKLLNLQVDYAYIEARMLACLGLTPADLAKAYGAGKPDDEGP